MNQKNWEKMFDSTWKREGNPFIQFLLDAGLDVNAVNKYGITLLSYSAKRGNLQIAEFLVHEGADADVANFNGSKPIHIAAQYGRTDIVKFFLSKGAFVDSCDNDKCTPLHYVAVSSKIQMSSAGRDRYQELINILVDHNADIDAVDSEGYTPMLHAVRFNRKHMVELFIKLGANVEYCDKRQWRVLHFACGKGWTGIVRTLVEGRFEIDLNSKTSDGFSPVIIAAMNTHENIVKLLIKSGAEVECNNDLLQYACQQGWLEMVKYLLSKKCDFNAKDLEGRTPLLLAAKFSHLSVVVYLIECGADVSCYNKTGGTMLHYACKRGWLEVVKSLVRKGCDLNSKDSRGRTPLIKAAICNRLSVVEYLIVCGADVKYYSTGGWTMMHYICSSGWVEVVKSLLSKKCDLNAKDLEGRTPLMVAAEFSQLSVVEYLIECGADVNGYDKHKWTMMHLACRKGWVEVVKSLLIKGCDFNAKDSYGRTPLLHAADFSRYSVVKYLIDCGADVKSCDLDGYTVLYYSCKRGWFNIVESLIEKGSDVNARTDNRTPLFLAIDENHVQIVKQLLNAGADCNVVNIGGKTALTAFVRRHCNFFKEISLEVIILFLRSGAYFQTEDFVLISNNSFLKEGILQNIHLCTVALINSYLADLSKIYEIPVISGRLPRIEKLKIISPNIEEDISESVNYEIKTKGYCNILNVHPIVLRRLCVLTLIKHYNS